MRRADDVYFFTLIDFLVQVFFFGLLLYVVGQGASADVERKQVDEAKKVKTVVGWTGFSTLTELTDYLGRLAPPTDFRGWADFMSKQGKVVDQRNITESNAARELVDRNGGVTEVERKLEAYAKAFGLPPCESTNIDGRIQPISIATVRLENGSISLVKTTGEFDKALSSADISLKVGDVLSLSEFRSRLMPIRLSHPDCRHFVDAEVKSDLLAPMDALQAVFRIASRR
jgi:hypothetical protein